MKQEMIHPTPEVDVPPLEPEAVKSKYDLEIPKGEEITRLIIEREDTPMTSHINLDENFDAKELMMNRRDASVGYYNLRNLKNTQKLEVFMREENGLREIALPQEMLDRITFYIKNEQKLQPAFDCFKFACLANDTFTKRYEDIPDQWERTSIFEDELEPGDTIMIADDGKYKGSKPLHFAIYLGNDLYISKAGYIGRLMVATVDEMVKCFGGKYISKLTPKTAAKSDKRV